MTEAEAERAAVVAYLRETAEIHLRWARTRGTTRGEHNHHANACRWAAEAIEMGEHLAGAHREGE